MHFSQQQPPPTRREAEALIVKYTVMVKAMNDIDADSKLAQFMFWDTELTRSLTQANLQQAFEGLCKSYDRLGREYTKDVIATKLLIAKQAELTPSDYFELLQAIAGYAASHTFKLSTWAEGASKHAEIKAKYLQEIANLTPFATS